MVTSAGPLFDTANESFSGWPLIVEVIGGIAERLPLGLVELTRDRRRQDEVGV